MYLSNNIMPFEQILFEHYSQNILHLFWLLNCSNWNGSKFGRAAKSSSPPAKSDHETAAAAAAAENRS